MVIIMETVDKNTDVRENKIIFICWLAYTAAYVGRLNFSASIVAIIAELGATKAQAGLVSSCFFFAYGAGQLVNGILSKRYNSRIMVFLSLAISSVLNLMMPLCGDISVMKYIWLANGIVQSVLWSTLIKTLSEFVSDENARKGNCKCYDADEADRLHRLENLIIPEDFDFDRVQSLSIECRQKLKKYAPRTIAQASRISGVSPADISVLLVYFGR